MILKELQHKAEVVWPLRSLVGVFMKNAIFFTLVGLYFLSLGCSVPQKNTTAGASWYSNMHRLSADLSAMTPLIYDQKAFYDPKNLALLQDKTKDMMEGAEELTRDSQAPAADPIIQFSAQQFAQDLKAAHVMLKVGNLQAAHVNLSQIGNYCISCHTRTDRGTQNYPLAEMPQLSSLTTWQKSQFHLVNRQYQAAYTETAKMVTESESFSRDLNGWLSTLYKNLAVIVRVKQDLKQAQSLVETILKNKNLPYYVRYDANAWLKSIKEWQKESAKNAKTDSLEVAKKWIEQARKSPFSQGQAGLILYLRASGTIHRLLEKTTSSTYPETLFYAGVVAEALKKNDLWRLGEHYFEVCIETTPHSLLAEQCYAQLEWVSQQSNPMMMINSDYAELAQKKLERLKKLSAVINDPDSFLRRYEMIIYQGK